MERSKRLISDQKQSQRLGEGQLSGQKQVARCVGKVPTDIGRLQRFRLSLVPAGFGRPNGAEIDKGKQVSKCPIKEVQGMTDQLSSTLKHDMYGKRNYKWALA